MPLILAAGVAVPAVGGEPPLPAESETLGVVRGIANPDDTQTEFAIILRSDLKGQGFGRALLQKMIRYCRSRGTGGLVGEVLSGNRSMLSLARDLGFSQRFDQE